MANPKYIITKDDCGFAFSWIDKKLRNNDLLKALDFERRLEAETAFNNGRMLTAHNKLNRWCETYLSSKEWSSLKASIRKKRQRLQQEVTVGAKPINIGLTPDAHRKLKAVADSEGVTMSQAIEKYFDAAYWEIRSRKK